MTADDLGGLVVVVLAAGIVGVLINSKRRKGRLDARKFYPTGDPAGDLERLRQWWTAEMAEAGVAGAVTIEGQACADGTPPWPGLKAYFQAMVLRTSQVVTARVYRAMIPSTPPLETVVFAAADGRITRVVFTARLRRSLDAVYTRMGGRPPEPFAGPDAAALNANPALLKAVHASLSFIYIVPGRNSNLSRESARLTLAGGQAIIDSLIHDQAFGRDFLFGLREALAAIQAIDQS